MFLLVHGRQPFPISSPSFSMSLVELMATTQSQEERGILTIIEPIPEAIKPMFHQVLCGSEIEPWID